MSGEWPQFQTKSSQSVEGQVKFQALEPLDGAASHGDKGNEMIHSLETEVPPVFQSGQDETGEIMSYFSF